ncbi:MFS transporter [Streptomyces sp. NPDC006516]|uniref:MFS transporter n=1 Tax=Streptomyces sp. NPDC006516 TaxID=3154309 RepID=UPI0033BF25C7
MTTEPALAGRKEWLALAVLALPLLLVSMDISILFFAVPAISADLSPTGTQLLWVFDIYAFVLAGLLITMGSVGDRMGRRKLLMAGTVFFGGASLIAAYASSAGMLIGARALLGVGGACLLPSTLSLIRSIFTDATQRAKALGVWSAVLISGVSLGPVLSGVMLEFFWWGSVFLINAPVMVLLLVLAPRLLPEFKDPHPGPFDAIGCLLSLGAILPVIYGIKELGTDGFEVVPVVAIVVGLVVAALFVVRQRAAAAPLLDLSLLRTRAFRGGVVFAMIASWVMIGFAIFTTQYLQSVQGMSALEASLWSLTPSVGIFLATGVSTGLAQRVDHAFIVGGAFVLTAGGLLFLTQVRADSPLWMVLVGAGGLSAGVAATMPLLTGMVVGSAPAEKAGIASATLQTGQELGGAVGLATLGTLGSAVYRNNLEGSVPDGLPAVAEDAARETLAAAVMVAGELPGATGDALLTAAREAFTDGLNAAALAGAGVLLLASLLVVLLLRGAAGPAVAGASEAADEPDGPVVAPETANPLGTKS